eukprot:CAMPEP_0118878100 /NCGR_PEP_ID=MMETSP1163-20130328/18139_1 /TAXON_ID=124430 /ORGANISM="Phaeomonas parva, Strain CCMP2877" /LENGTH=138 /DNA_ID=CAMNT_0006813891 /DNA_START=258 /DNA_END=670 /DNA_ORIENTATION=+
MASLTAEDRLDYAVLAHLRAKGGDDVEKAIALLEGALRVGRPSAAERKALEYPTSLSEIFGAGVEATGAKTKAEAQEELKQDPLFQTLLKNLAGRGFFNNVEEGSPEYEERFEKVIKQYEKRRAASAEAKGDVAPAAP